MTVPPPKISVRFAALALVALAGGCIAQTDSSTTQRATAAQESAEQTRVAINLLVDPYFDGLAMGERSGAWSVRQHAGAPGFEIRFPGDGRAVVESLGTQPWMIITQRLNIREYCSKSLTYNAELKLNLNNKPLPRSIHSRGGLFLTLLGSDNRRQGDFSFQHEPSTGIADWTDVRIAMQAPDNCDTVEIGFSLQSNGTMEVRNLHFGPPVSEAATP